MERDEYEWSVLSGVVRVKGVHVECTLCGGRCTIWRVCHSGDVACCICGEYMWNVLYVVE